MQSDNLLTEQTLLSDFPQSVSELQTWKLTLAYDGTDFRGWQVQPGQPTVQAELQAALGRITGESPLPQGSGRTDAGVHALAQVASFALQTPIPPQNLLRALNRTLPPSIRILETRVVFSTFHARHSAKAKTYEYRVFREAVCPPFLARYVHACPWLMDVKTLQESARLFVGEYDFRSFAASDPDLTSRKSTANPETDQTMGKSKGTVRTIFSSAWEERRCESGNLLIYRVRGNGFLHHMVRNLVGTMLDVGRGHLQLSQIPGIIAARSRSAAGPTAPASGLFLHSVEYDEQDSIQETRQEIRQEIRLNSPLKERKTAPSRLSSIPDPCPLVP
jgi:tRNA pseudouridine38-40 synthase